MSRHEYELSRVIESQQFPFYSLIMAAMRQADTQNTNVLKAAYPAVWRELKSRYEAVGGALPEDKRA